MLTDPLFYPCLILLVMWAWAELRHLLALHRWEQEREQLLDRLQSPSLAAYKAQQRADKIASGRLVAPDERPTPSREPPAPAPSDADTAALGEGLVRQVTRRVATAEP